MKYFKNVTNLQELRSQYRALAFKFHPDRGGDTAIMQEINAEYEKLSKFLIDGNETFTEARKSYEHQASADILEKINEIINLPGLVIEIIGSWIWITGNTFPNRKELAKAGFKFMKNKTAWSWHSGEFRKSSNRLLDLDEIRNLYGSETVVNPSAFYTNLLN